MSQIRNCPSCKEPLDQDEKSCPCGWKAQRTRAQAGPVSAYPACSWTSNGVRCRYPGSMSTTTLAQPDSPWFCSAHFDCTDPVFGALVVEASRDYVHQRSNLPEVQAAAAAYCAEQGLETVAQMQAYSRNLVKSIGRKPGGTDWARRILDRIEAGEDLPAISAEKARLALGISTTPAENAPQAPASA